MDTKQEEVDEYRARPTKTRGGGRKHRTPAPDSKTGTERHAGELAASRRAERTLGQLLGGVQHDAMQHAEGAQDRDAGAER